MSEDRGREQVNRRVAFALICLALLCPVLIFVNLCTGSTGITAADVMAILAGNAKDATAASIILQIRFPRAVAAMILGGALGLSGYLLQTFFRNPIAGPFVLGISSGARLFVAVLLIFCAMRSGVPSSFSLISAAFAGALLSMAFVLLFSTRIRRTSTLIVAGIMIGYICSAATDFIVTFADDAQIVSLHNWTDAQIVSLHNWTRGSLSGMNWADVAVMSVLTLLCLAGIFLLAKPISAYRLGEDYARSLGVSVPVLRALLVLFSSLLAACVTAYAGPVSFVGIAVPQLIRALLRTERPLVLIPACFLGGGIFCLVSDLIARSILSPAELSISTVTAVFGAPVVIAILLRRKGEV